MPETKMSAEEMRSYYVRLHRQAISRDRHEDLSAVTDITADRWVNSFTDYAHRLGMKRVFKFLADEWGSLSGRSALDLGCGRGRWSKEYAARGAKVTGVDISPDAIRLLAAEMPQHRFICQDIPALRFARESFDIVSSVTVVQHLPLERQQLSLRLMSQWLKPNGYLIMLENVLAFDAPHVFPHRTDEWVRMVESTGLKRRCCWGSNYEVLFRVEARILRLLRGNKQTRDAMVPSPQPNGAHASRLKSAAKTLVAGLSFPAEWVCQKVPLATPTHSVMIFSK